MQPSAATSRARATYCCWLPPQPCTNSTPGISVPGVTSVPAMCCSPTAISSASSSVVAIEFHRVLRQATAMRIDPAKVDERTLGYRARLVVNLDGRAAHPRAFPVALECREGDDLGSAGAADAPRLFEHACAGAL